MHEKDIQLARLLIARQTELGASGSELRRQVADVERRMQELRSAAEERNTYADILAKAADLLQRDDLTVEEPDTSSEESELVKLNEQLAELEQQEVKFRELVEQLRDRAPQLFDAATGELSVNGGPEQQKVHEASQAAEPDAQYSEEEDEVEEGPTAAAETTAIEAPAEDWDQDVKVYVAGRQRQLSPEDEEYLARETARQQVQAAEPEAAPAVAASAPDEPLTEEELDRFLQRFNMDVIQRQALQTLSADAVFVVDAASVMNNIPYYDNSIRGGPVKFIREELLRDFGLLARHLDRRVHLVLDFEHTPEQSLGESLTLQTLRGGDQGQRPAQDSLLKSVLAEAAQRTQVCLVTGELGLGGSLRSRRVQFLPVTDFFRM